MATYEEFKELMREKAEKEIGGRATIQTVQKNNGVKMDALVIMTRECNVSPSIYLNSYYKEYLDCTEREEALEEIWQEIKNVYYRNQPRENIDMGFLTDYNKVKEMIRMKIVNTEKNREWLEDKVFISYLDLSIVFTIAMGIENCAMATITVRKDFLEYWEVDASDLWEIAVENMAEDYKVVPIGEILSERFDIREELGFDSGLYVLTNHSATQGAVSMVLPGLLCREAKKLAAEKFVILPSSVHEVLLLVANDEKDMEIYNHMVKEVNSAELIPEEVLSEHAYIYDRKTDKVEIG